MKYDAGVKAPRKTRQTRAKLAFRFRVLCADAGLSVHEAAKLLHVTPRTIYAWFSGKTAVPYAAYKLVRIMGRFELPMRGFEGWCMHSGKLWTPEGLAIAPEDGAWWSLLVRQARGFRTLYQRQTGFDLAMRHASATEGPRLRGGAGADAGPALSPFAPVHPDFVRSPLVITGITHGLPQSEMNEVQR